MKVFGLLHFVFLSVLNGVQLNRFCNTFLNVADDKTHVYKYGDSVHFNCEVRNTTTIAVDNTNFYLLQLESKNKFPITKVSGNVGYVNVMVISKESGGNYSCRYDNCTVDGLLTIYEIKVDKCSFPKETNKAPSTIECKVNDLSNMTCDWKPLRDDGCTTWKALYKSEEMDIYECCSSDDKKNCTSSSSSRHCTIPDKDFYRFIPYNIKLIEASEQGTYQYNYTVVGDNTIASVDIYPGVRIEPGFDAHTLMVGITLHHPPSSVGGIMCHVTYLSEWKLQNDLTVTFDSGHLELEVNITLTYLTPFTLYTVNISCKPLTSRYWSNQVMGAGRTNPAAPLNAPKIIAYSNTLTTTPSTSSNVFLYLEPLKKNLWYGGNTSYLIRMAGNDTINKQTISADTVTSELYPPIDKNESHSVISVRTENEAGFSKWSDPVQIVNFNAEAQDRHRLVVEQNKGNIQLLLFSKNGYNNEKLTYYYCRGERNTYPPICKTNLVKTTEQSFKLLGNWTYYSNDWYFGFVSPEDGKRIIWSSCVFSSDNAVSHKQTQLELSASTLPSNESVVNLRLLFDYCNLKQRPLSYQVAFFEVKQNDSCNNYNLSAFQIFTATPYVRDLQVFVESMAEVVFCFRVQYNSSNYERGHISVHLPRKYDLVHVPDREKKTGKNATVIISVICAIIVCVLLFLFIMLCRKRMKTLHDRNTISDDIFTKLFQDSPELLSSQNESSSESSESSGIYSISRSVSHESANNDQTNIKTLNVHQDETSDQTDVKTVHARQDEASGSENSRFTVLQLPLRTLTSKALSDSADSFPISGSKEMLGNESCIENVLSEEIDGYTIPVTEVLVENQSEGYEVACGNISTNTDDFQGKGQKGNISRLVSNEESSIHNVEVTLPNGIIDSTTYSIADQFHVSTSLSVGEYHEAVVPESYDLNTLSNDGGLSSRINSDPERFPPTLPSFDNANIQQITSFTRNNHLNFVELPRMRDDSFTPFSSSCPDYVIVEHEGEESSMMTLRNSSASTGLTSSDANHLFHRQHTVGTSRDLTNDSDEEPADDYQIAAISTITNDNVRILNYPEMIELTDRR